MYVVNIEITKKFYISERSEYFRTEKQNMNSF